MRQDAPVNQAQETTAPKAPQKTTTPRHSEAVLTGRSRKLAKGLLIPEQYSRDLHDPLMAVGNKNEATPTDALAVPPMPSFPF
jgi:hypothetical protein